MAAEALKRHDSPCSGRYFDSCDPAGYGRVAVAQRGRYTSPPASTSVEIAGKKISVDYYAPSTHGRKVMGGLVPYGTVWCRLAPITATKITTRSPAVQMGRPESSQR